MMKEQLNMADRNDRNDMDILFLYHILSDVLQYRRENLTSRHLFVHAHFRACDHSINVISFHIWAVIWIFVYNQMQLFDCKYQWSSFLSWKCVWKGRKIWNYNQPYTLSCRIFMCYHQFHETFYFVTSHTTQKMKWK